MNSILIQNLKYFNDKLIEIDDKKHFHYRSVNNLLGGIIKYNSTQESNSLKEGLLDFFTELDELDYDLSDKIESINLYKNYLAPTGKYLIIKEGFRTKMNFKMNIVIGIIADIILVYSLTKYHYPVFLLLGLVFSIWQRHSCIKSNKFFSLFW